MKKQLYQTVDDKDNPDEVESIGPFKCSKEPWLGEGYYFWDTFIELAHWWGRQGYQNSYMICEATCEDNDKIFDLVGNTEHMQIMHDYSKLLKKKEPNLKITVPSIIMHMREIIRNFPYNAIRASGVDTINQDGSLKKCRIKFNYHTKAYLDLKPAIQICIIDKQEMGFSGYKVIYPEEYVQD